MSSDLVKRLRLWGEHGLTSAPSDLVDAADRIEALEGEVTKAREIAAELNSGWKESIEISWKNYAAWKEADARAERLLAVLEEIASGRYSGLILPSYPPQDPAVVRARKAIEDDKQ